MSSAVIQPPAPEAAPLSEGARLVNTFIAPSKTFTDLRRSAAWWAPFLLIVVVSYVFMYVVDKKVGFARVAENQIQASPKNSQRFEQMAPDERARAMEMQIKVTRRASYGFPVLIMIWWLIIAAVLLATFKFGFTADLTFKASLAVVIYSSLPGILKSLLAILSILAGVNTDAFNIQNPVATNPGYFLTQADSPALFTLASALDIFMIWTLVLAAIGISCVSKVKKGTAMGVIFGWYAFITLVGVGIAAAFS